MPVIASINFEIEVDNKKHAFDFSVVNNLNEMGLDVQSAISNFAARVHISDINVWSFCEYVTSKDPFNILCIPEEQYNLLIKK